MFTRKTLLKTLGALIAVAVLLALLPGAVMADDPPASVTVCATECDYTSIQEGIDAVAEGGTVNVAAGTYNEAITLNKKDITVKSTDGADVTIIDVPAGKNRGVHAPANMGAVTIDGFSVINITQEGIIQGMGDREGTTFHVRNNRVVPKENCLRNGIQVTGDGSTVIGNFVKGALLTEEWSGTAIGVVNASNVLIQGNVISGTEYGVVYGILVYTWDFDKTIVESIENVQVLDNIIYNADYPMGVQAYSGTIDGVTFKYNQVTNYTEAFFAEVFSDGGYSGVSVNNIDASPNWWGSPTGPAEGAIDGDIKVAPWCTNAECTAFGPPLDTVYVDDDWVGKTPGDEFDGHLFGYDAFAIIQDGIDVVAEGASIYVAPGVYKEKLSITKSVHLIGPNADVKGYETRGPEATLTFPDGLDQAHYHNNIHIQGTLDTKVDGVTIKGFRFNVPEYLRKWNPRGILSLLANNVVIENNFFDETSEAIRHGNAIPATNNTYGVVVRGNKIDGGVFKQSQNSFAVHAQAVEVEITDNVIENVYYGFWFKSNHIDKPSVVSNNTISTVNEGFRYYSNYNDNGLLTVENNTFTIADPGVLLPKAEATQLYNQIHRETNLFYQLIDFSDASRSITLKNNTIDLASPLEMRTVFTHSTGAGSTWTITINGEGHNHFLNFSKFAYLDDATTVNVTESWWGSILGPDLDNSTYGEGKINYSPWCGDAACSFLVHRVLEGEIDETITVTEGQTILLANGTVIDPTTGPCFAITGNNVKIMTESPLGAVCKPGSPGITVADGAVNIIIEGLEIDGGGTAEGHGIHFEGAVTDVIISDTFIHGMKGDGVYFAAQPGGYVELKGNLFMGNTGFGVNAPGDLDVKFNAWGAYGGPAAGDGVSTNITSFVPWTHVDVFMEYVDSTHYDNEVALEDETITYAVKANLQKAFGAEFILTFNPAYLQVESVANGTIFTLAEDMEALVVDNTAGTIRFAAGSFEERSGEGLVLYTVVFKPAAITPETPPNPLLIPGKQGISLFAMSPGSASSLNIYPAALTGIDDVNVYKLPTLAAAPLDGYDVGNPKEFTLKVENPAAPDGRDYEEAKVCLDVPTGAVLEYWDGTAWVPYDPDTCLVIGELKADDEKEYKFQITFPAAGDEVPVTVKLYDDDIFLVEDTFKFEVKASYAFTGSVQMQGRTVRAGVLVDLVGPYTYQALSTAPISGNFSFANVAKGTYKLSITHDRYLSLISHAITINETTLNWGRFELKGGDLNKNEEIDIGDASLVGSNYGATGDNDGDANFDGRVNIQDLAMVGGNYLLTSVTAYTTVPTWGP